jgi:hypothetical protein
VTQAVLREVDQRDERSPAACVKTGQTTDRAIRTRAVGLERTELWEGLAGSTLTLLVARLLRRPTTSVVLAVSAPAWKRWRRRLLRAVLLLSCGLGIVVAGAIRGEVGLIVLGAVLAVVSWWLRRRAWLACWVGLTYRPQAAETLVTRVHPAFANEARRIYVASLRRHPAPR